MKTRTAERLLIVFAVASLLFCGVTNWLEIQQNQLADKVVRLHVIANSDSEEDQALKLQVRDAVLKQADLLAGEAGDAAAARELLSAHLAELAQTGQEVVAAAGYDYPVTASLENTYFPTKVYTDFSLPAGNYEALRVVIGEGDGQNWWCVVFPPLCLGSVSEQSEEVMADGLSAEDISFLTGEDEGYVVKFKCMELWERLKHALK